MELWVHNGSILKNADHGQLYLFIKVVVLLRIARFKISENTMLKLLPIFFASSLDLVCSAQLCYLYGQMMIPLKKVLWCWHSWFQRILISSEKWEYFFRDVFKIIIYGGVRYLKKLMSLLGNIFDLTQVLTLNMSTKINLSGFDMNSPQ